MIVTKDDLLKTIRETFIVACKEIQNSDLDMEELEFYKQIINHYVYYLEALDDKKKEQDRKNSGA